MGFPPQGTTPISVTRDTYIDMIPEEEFEISQAPETENNVVNVTSSAAYTSLNEKSITVDIPTGATITKVMAMARIHIMNNTPTTLTAQKISLRFEVDSTIPRLFDQANVVGFGAVDGASTAYVIAEDATGEVTLDNQTVTLEAFAMLSTGLTLPESVRFQAQYYLFIVYRMGS